MSCHQIGQSESIKIPRQIHHSTCLTTHSSPSSSSSSKRNTTSPLLLNDDFRLVKPSTLSTNINQHTQQQQKQQQVNTSNNSFSEQRLAASITDYLYSSLSPPSPSSYKLNDFKCSESFKESQLSNLVSFNKRVSTAFIPDDEVQKNDQIAMTNEIVKKLYSEMYSNDAQIDDIIRIMSFHPNFLKEFQKFTNYVMYSQGALSYESRHYLAMIAAARHNCFYLVNQQETEFLSIKNGNKKWLTSRDNVPQKLRDLFELNKLLCHQPWLINRSHIENLLMNEYSNQWSITELIMAATILSHFHALSGFVFGLGINENFLQELALKHHQQLEENEQKKKLDHNNNSNSSASNQTEELCMFDEDDEEEYDCCTDDFNQENTFEFSDLNDNLTQHISDTTSNKLNRTMSNSSASSCEIGIEMLLKEMQMIQADDMKLNNEENKLLNTLSSSSSNNNNNNNNNNNTITSNTNNLSSISMSSTITNMHLVGSSSMRMNAQSGSNTISNSPISSSFTIGNTSGPYYCNYLTDSSNCSSPKYSHSFNAMHHHAKRLVSSTSNNHRSTKFNSNNENENDEDSDLDCSTMATSNNLRSKQFNDNDDTKLFNYQFDESDSLMSSNAKTNAFILNKSNGNSHRLSYKNYKKIKSNNYNQNRTNGKNNSSNSITNTLAINNTTTSPSSYTSSTNGCSLNSQMPSLVASPSSYSALVHSQTNTYMMKYKYDPEFTRINFKYADQSLRLEFFTWERQGFSTASSIYSDICDLLDRKFRNATTMTYNTMGCHNNVDTSLFRRAIWLYIQSLFGVRYDDYDYKQIKQLMGSPLRNYIKILCSCPERVTKKDYEKIMKEFTHSEKVHLNIVIMEARIQASLLYFLRAINSYFS